jgi:fluoroacetyl-CoA thioesterase
MPPVSLPVGLTARRSHAVTEVDTADELGSGDLAVLATPRLLAWMEGVTCLALADRLDPGETSVGTRVTLEHLKATAVGGTLDVVATLHHADGRLVRFEVIASDATDVVVGRADITRVIVDTDRFLARLAHPPR